jgi:tetratricopeptide (TPR) repeat protein
VPSRKETTMSGVFLDPCGDLYRVGVEHLERNEVDQAIATLTEVLNVDDQYVNAYLARGEAYQEKGDLVHAIADFSSVIRIIPEKSHAYRLRAAAHEAKGDQRRAQADYARAAELQSRHR